MVDGKPPIAATAADAPKRPRPAGYPEPFASRVIRNEKRPLGDLFGLTHFGVNLTRLPPGSISALRHAHLKHDEFVYVLEGHPVLVTDEGDTALSPGMCAGFKAGTGNAHHLVNRTDCDVLYLEIGDRIIPEVVTYPDDDIHGSHGEDGRWGYLHKDGTPY
jgi:uncharacterized cupin superfamily protein